LARCERPTFQGSETPGTLSPDFRGVLEPNDGAAILFTCRGYVHTAPDGVRQLVGAMTHISDHERYRIPAGNRLDPEWPHLREFSGVLQPTAKAPPAGLEPATHDLDRRGYPLCLREILVNGPQTGHVAGGEPAFRACRRTPPDQHTYERGDRSLCGNCRDLRRAPVRQRGHSLGRSNFVLLPS
jgi:hypothetical protein